jgi:pyruvate/2-oxoglutarate dehydrogenase complex dihydrolipoamide dehydrogenase (E3) component
VHRPQAVPTKIEKQVDGKLRAFWKNADTGEESSDVFDTIFVATGRTADTTTLALDKAGVLVEKE